MKKRLPVFIVTLIAISIILVGCGSPREDNDSHENGILDEPARQIAFTMGTVAELTAYGTEADEAIARVVTELNRLSGAFDRFTAGSDIHRLNASAGEWVTVGQETIALAQVALDWAEQTDGSFDPTIAPIIDLWGFIEESEGSSGADSSPTPMQGQAPPAKGDIDQTLRFVDYNQVFVDEAASKLRLGLPDARLDLGGIAKGYAADRAVDILKEHGIESALVNLGGDMFALGTKPDGTPWRIGVVNPRNTETMFAVISVSNQAVVTSGDYERYFEYEGVRYTHLINPKTGYPQQELASVTIVAPKGVTADALATAVSVMGIEKGIALLQSVPGVDGLLVDTDGNVEMTSGMRERVELAPGF